MIASAAQLIDPNSPNALTQMAESEFAIVKSIDLELLLWPHVAKLKLIWALDGHQVNTESRRESREQHADLLIEELPTKHASVIDPTTVMDYAARVGILIQDLAE